MALLFGGEELWDLNNSGALRQDSCPEASHELGVAYAARLRKKSVPPREPGVKLRDAAGLCVTEASNEPRQKKQLNLETPHRVPVFFGTTPSVEAEAARR